MRVYLVNPPAVEGVGQVREGRCMQRESCWTAVWAPISLATMAKVLREHGHEVKISDCIVERLDFDQLSEIAKEFNPGLLVANVVTPAIVSDLSTADLVKRAVSDVRVAVFGIHPTALPEHCFSLSKGLDYAVRGEPEITVAEIADALEGERSVQSVSGISYRDEGGVVHNPARPPLENLDELAFPAWDLIDTNLYRMPFTRSRFLLVGTSRGCPYPCTFCADKAYYGTRLRLRSPRSIADELERNKRDFGVDEALFWSESFTLNRKFALAVAEELIERNLGVKWVCNSRVDHVDLELCQKLRLAGCHMIGFGVESGVQWVLDSVRKHVTLEDTRNAVAVSKKAGLDVVAHCVLGFPGETEETVRETIRFVKGLKVDFAQFYCAVPFPGSELYEEALAKGYINTDDWAMFEQNYSILDTPSLKACRVMQLRRKAYLQFYLSPHAIRSTLKRVRSPRGFWNFLKMAFDFVRWL